MKAVRFSKKSVAPMTTMVLDFAVSEEDSGFLFDLQRKYSPVIRFAYNRFISGKKITEVNQEVARIFSGYDSWILASCVYEAKGMAAVDTENDGKIKKRIFGGRTNMRLRREGKITGEEYKQRRISPLPVVGEALPKGNRKFLLDIENKKIIFKCSKNKHIELNLTENLKGKRKQELERLQILMQCSELPVSIKINKNKIFLSYSIEKLEHRFDRKYRPKSDRFMAIDMNPNHIGIVIYDNAAKKVLHQELINFQQLTIKSKESSSSKKSKYLDNKLDHETIQAAKYLIRLAKSFNVGVFAKEDLNIKSKDAQKGKRFNRLAINVWKRNLLDRILTKDCYLAGIRVMSIHCAYSSVIGNVHYEIPDPCAAASEICRRAIQKTSEKSITYPQIAPSSYFLNLWKKNGNVDEMGSLLGTASWKIFNELVKKSKLRYRFPIPEESVFRELGSSKTKCKHLVLPIVQYVL